MPHLEFEPEHPQPLDYERLVLITSETSFTAYLTWKLAERFQELRVLADVAHSIALEAYDSRVSEDSIAVALLLVIACKLIWADPDSSNAAVLQYLKTLPRYYDFLGDLINEPERMPLFERSVAADSAPEQTISQQLDTALLQFIGRARAAIFPPQAE